MSRANQVSLSCRAIADPKVIISHNGYHILDVRCVHDAGKMENGEWKKRPMFLNVKRIRKGEDGLNIQKGDDLLVTGSLAQDEWQDKTTGEKKTSATYIMAAMIAKVPKRNYETQHSSETDIDEMEPF